MVGGEQRRVAANQPADLAPQQALEVVERRRGGGVDLGVFIRFEKPDRDPRGAVRFARRVARPRDGDRVIAHAAHQRDDILGVILAEDVAPKADRIGGVALHDRLTGFALAQFDNSTSTSYNQGGRGVIHRV